MGVLIPFAELIPIQEVQCITGLKRHQIYYLLSCDAFPIAAKFGKAARWTRRDVQQWADTEAAVRGQAVRRVARSTTAPAGSSAPTIVTT
jgi:predicted DNA-binding transcriptional regulator AlpA